MELRDLTNIDGKKILPGRLAILPSLLAAVANLHSGESWGDSADKEYLRGQIELIADFCGIDIELAWDELPIHIFTESIEPPRTWTTPTQEVYTVRNGQLFYSSPNILTHLVACTHRITPSGTLMYRRVNQSMTHIVEPNGAESVF